jgi:hypothetical protein
MEADMTTPRTRALVSLAATITVTLALGACARASSQPAVDEALRVESRSVEIRFDNAARDFVQVYLVADNREWRLGRVEAGSVATLRIPEAALGGNTRSLRLAVLAGERLTVRAALDPRATFTIMQPMKSILSQQWRFAEGQVSPERVWNPR